MAESAEKKHSSVLSYCLLIAALLAVVLGVWGFYYFQEQSTLYSVLAVLAGIFSAVGLLYYTTPGQRVFSYVKASRTEIRKVVWPTRQEAVQTLIMVTVLTGILSLFLLLCDFIAGKSFEALMS